MKRALHILILVVLGLSMSNFQCSHPFVGIPCQVGVVNNSDSEVVEFEFMTKRFTSYISIDPPILPERHRIQTSQTNVADELFSFRITLKNGVVVVGTTKIDNLPPDGASVAIDLIVNEDYTMIIKQYPLLGTEESQSDRFLSF